MLGRYTVLALSGATITNQLFFFIQQLIAGNRNGCSRLGSQYWEEGDGAYKKNHSPLGLLLSVSAGIIFFAVTFAFPKGTLSLLTNG
jgi:Na+-driven multidrug efflux pump